MAVDVSAGGEVAADPSANLISRLEQVPLEVADAPPQQAARRLQRVTLDVDKVDGVRGRTGQFVECRVKNRVELRRLRLRLGAQDVRHRGPRARWCAPLALVRPVAVQVR